MAQPIAFRLAARFPALCLLMGISLSAWSADYPAWRNDGSGAATDCGKTLVESLADAKELWQSEAELHAVYTHRLNQTGGPDGGYSNPSVGGGRVYVQQFIPTGDIREQASQQRSKMKEDSIWLIDAEDVVTSMDMRSGKTSWQRRLPGGVSLWALSGILHSQMVVAGERLFLQGSLGKVWCLKTSDGSTLWESNLGKSYEKMVADLAAWKATSESERYDVDAKYRSHKGGKNNMFGWVFIASPQLLGDTLVCATPNGGEKSKAGLVGLDAASGQQRWHVPAVLSKRAPPMPWEHAGKQYAIACADDQTTCIDPGNGKVVWKAAIAHSNAAVPAIKGDLLVSVGDGKKGKHKAGLSCYELSPSGATKKWSLGQDEFNSRCCPVIYKDHVYAYIRTGTSSPRYWLCVNLSDGSIVAKLDGAPKLWSGLVAGDDRLLHGACFIKADPSDFKRLGDGGKKFVGGVGFGGGPSCITSSMADGLIFVRGRNRLFCYDLKK